MTPTPPPETAPAPSLLTVLRDLADQWMRQPDSAYDCGATLAAMIEWAEVSSSETVEYRVTTIPPSGDPIQFDARDFQAQFWLDHAGTDGYPPAVVECRTVTTITSRSGWRLVPDDTEARDD